MKTINLKSPYEPLDVEIEGQVVKTAINVSVDGLLDLSDACKKAHQRMQSLETLRDKAKKGKDPEKVRKLNAEMAKVMEGPIKQAIGEADYDAIVAACGMGRAIKKEDCNVVFGRVFAVINETVNERHEDSLNDKAAHYLAEVDDAQPEPDPED